jgi:hypothetical protein
MTERNGRRPSDVLRPCEQCGTEFYAPIRKIRKGQARFCSKACFAVARIVPIEDRFWKYVDQSSQPDACWLWTGSVDENGYGHVGVDGHTVRSHRISWELAHGPVPDKMHVLHNCPTGDDPACVNPAHLWLGTHTENMRDRSTKGHHPGTTHLEKFPCGDRHWAAMHPELVSRGENRSDSKLTNGAVREIRRKRDNGTAKLTELAEEFGVSISAISNVALRKTWKHVPEGDAA